VVDAVNNGLWQVGRGAGEVVDKALLCKHSSTTMHAGATLKQCLSVCTHKFSTLLSLISPTQVLDLALVEQDNATSLEGAEWRAMSDQERLAACTPLRVLAKASPHSKLPNFDDETHVLLRPFVDCLLKKPDILTLFLRAIPTERSPFVDCCSVASKQRIASIHPSKHTW
jgi:hypothetical protein